MPRRPDPIQELLDLQERMNRLFEQTLGRERPDEPHVLHGAWVPPSDVYETPAEYVIEIDLPGLRREDVAVQIHGVEVFVRGERPAATSGRPDTFHRMERRHGPFVRAFRLAEEVDPDGVSAELTDGVLRLRVPKTRSSRRIAIETA